MAEEAISSFDNKNVSVLNEELRLINGKVRQLNGGLPIASTTGILTVSRGGTGQDFSTATADTLAYFDSAGHMAITNSSGGDSSKVLRGDFTFSDANENVPIALKWGQIDSSTSTSVGIGTSNVNLLGGLTNHLPPLQGYIYWIFNSASYDDQFQKEPIVFEKKSTINTIAGSYYMWEQSGGAGGGGGRQVSCYVDIGGNVSTTSTSQSTTPTEKTWSVDVSGLTNGTKYTIKLMCRDDIQGGNSTIGYVAKMIGYVTN